MEQTRGNYGRERDASDDKKKELRRCKVLIVGAGAAGLVCARNVLTHFQNVKDTIINTDDTDDTHHNDKKIEERSMKVEDVIILEARDRVGGRIHSVQKSIKRVGQCCADGSFSEINSEEASCVDFILEEGAAWVHGTGITDDTHDDESNDDEEENNPMINLLQEFSDGEKGEHYSELLEVVSPNGNPWTRPRLGRSLFAIFCSGNRIDQTSPGLLDNALGKFERIMNSVTKVANAAFLSGMEDNASKISVADTISLIQSDAPSHLNLSSKKDDDDNLETLIEFYYYLQSCWYTSPLSDLQLAFFIGDENFNNRPGGDEGDFPGPHCIVPKGMNSLLEPLMTDAVKNSIQCNQEVINFSQKTYVGIEQKETTESVVVTTSSGLVVEADVCVITIPLGCLKEAIKNQNYNDAMFIPALSKEKIEAINNISMGCYKKVFFTFSKIFWPVNEPFIGVIRKQFHSSDPSAWLGHNLLIDNLWARNGIPCFEVFLVGRTAELCISKSDKFICDNIIRFLQQSLHNENMNGSSIQELLVDCHVTRWEEDKFSRGAYSGYVLGTQSHHSEALVAPEWNGKLIFAGEANIAEYEGSVHAAIMSGEEASENVISFLDQ